jgi:hypothetical protein
MSKKPVSDRWRQALARGVVSGTMASTLSAAALAACGHIDEGSIAGPLNGPSQWLWGERGARRRDATLSHTAVGYLIHHSTSVMWATLFEYLLGEQRRRKSAARHALEAGLMAAGAYVVDYHLTPPRFQPGFEKHLRPASMVSVYAAFAAGLALTQIVRDRRGRGG